VSFCVFQLRRALGRACVVFTLLCGFTEVQAAIVVTAQQSGSDVVATLTGSFDVSITPSGTTNYFELPSVLGGDNAFPANIFNFSNGGTAGGLTRIASNVSAPFARFGSGTSALTPASSFTVSSANMNVRYLNGTVGDLFMSPAYTGGPLNESMTFANTTMETLGLDNYGSYIFTYGTGGTTDTVTVNLIPEPSTYAMALAGLACSYSMWRWRKRV